MKLALDPLAIADRAKLAPVAASLIHLQQNQQLTSLVVTSCNAGEGKTTVAIQIARAAVLEVGLRVLLIDFNPAHPQLADLFGCNPLPGLSDYLDGQVEAESIIRPTSMKNFDLLPFGSRRTGRASRYDPTHLQAKLTALRPVDGTGYDLVVADGPSSFSEPDLVVSARLFDGVVMVIECERTRWEVFKNYQDLLLGSQAQLLGAVMNRRRYYIPKALYV
jgi:Mrp family chromosome partitioning ATPase